MKILLERFNRKSPSQVYYVHLVCFELAFDIGIGQGMSAK